jgi:hypothetical protein
MYLFYSIKKASDLKAKMAKENIKRVEKGLIKLLCFLWDGRLFIHQ